MRLRLLAVAAVLACPMSALGQEDAQEYLLGSGDVRSAENSGRKVGNSWYVRPKLEGGYGDANGADYDNAFNGWTGINANWRIVRPGDTVFFAGTFCATREGYWLSIGRSGVEGAYIYLKSCTLSNGAEVNDPWIMDWRSSLPGWAEGNWYQHPGEPGYRWYFRYTTGYKDWDPRRMFFTKIGDTGLTEGQMKCDVNDVISEYDWYVDRESNDICVYASDEPPKCFSAMKSSNYLYRADAISASGTSWIDISGFTAYGSGADYAMRFINVDHLSIHDITWYDSHTIATIHPAGKGSGPQDTWTTDDTTEYVWIYNNTFDSRFTLDNRDPRIDRHSLGAGINFQDSVRYSKIYRNTIRNFMKTIQLFGARESDKWLCGVEHNQVYENDISCPSLGYGYVLLMGCAGPPLSNYADGFLQCNDIYRNYFHDFTNAVMIAGDHVRFYSNVIENVLESSRKGKAHGSAGLHIGQGKGGKIYNNTIFDTDEAGIRINDPPNEDIYFCPSDYEIINNILWNCATDKTPDAYQGISGPYSIVVHANDDGDDPRKLVFMNNLIYSPARGEYSAEVSYRGKAYPVWAWACCETNSDIIQRNLQTDPLFVDPFHGDVHLRPESPAIDRGIDLGLSADFSGAHVPVGNGPDIGTHEFGAYPSVECEEFNATPRGHVLAGRAHRRCRGDVYANGSNQYIGKDRWTWQVTVHRKVSDPNVYYSGPCCLNTRFNCGKRGTATDYGRDKPTVVLSEP